MPIDPVTLGIASSVISGIFGGSAAKKAKRAARRKAKMLSKKSDFLENNIQAIINPYEGILDLSSMATDRSGQMSNAYANLSVATSESWRDKNSGERREKTEWHRVVIFNEGLCKIAEQYLKKGSKVYLEGQLQTRKWTDDQGVEKYSTEVILQQYRGDLTLLANSGNQIRQNEPLATEINSGSELPQKPPSRPDGDVPF